VREWSPEPATSELPLLNRFAEADIVTVAWGRGIPVLQIGRLSAPATLEALAAYAPDVVAVACFDQKFPPELLNVPRFGCLNLHPSLLPAFRGPAPLFWIFRQGESSAGATVHLMAERIDAGPIVAQAPVAVPDGIRGDQLEAQCAAVGAELMAGAIRSLARGTADPRPQDEELSSYFPWPSAEDFVVPVNRPARWAYNFIRGVAHWSGPLAIDVAGRRLAVRDAVAFEARSRLSADIVREGDEVLVQCAPGVLRAKLYDT
jgi:methionyl-tRNA formyltransferase